MNAKYALTGSAKVISDSESQYSEIKEALNRLGMTETSIENCNYLIFMNYNRKSYKKYLKLKKKPKNLVLIRFEPIAVFPIQYRKSIERKFELIIDPGGIIKSDSKTDFLGWPYKYNLNPALPNASDPKLDTILDQALKNNLFSFEKWNNRRNKIVLIASNKVSPTSKSNYKKRRKIVRQMSPNEIDVYGDLWCSSISKKLFHRITVGFYAFRIGYFPNLFELYGGLFLKYSNCVGTVIDKHLVIQKYKYSLVIENSNDYCSEKLFDAIINGSIPIYIGPKNEHILLPKNLYYWCNGSVKDIRGFVGNLDPKRNNDMLRAMETFIKSDDFKNYWTSEQVYLNISEKIHNFWNIR